MRHPLLLPLLLCSALYGHAQSGPITPVPAWKAGDKREVTVTTTARITLDSSAHTLTTQSSYTLEALKVLKDGYILELHMRYMEGPALGAHVAGLLGSDGTGQHVQTNATAMRRPMALLTAIGTRFRISLAGDVVGQVDPIGDVERMRPAMAKAISTVLDSMARAKGEQQPLDLSKSRLDFLTDSLYGAFNAVQVHELKELFRAYGTTYPLTGSMRVNVRMEDVLSPLGHLYTELPATVEAGLDRYDAKSMTCRRITTYDPETVHARVAKTAPFAEAKLAEVSWKDETAEELDRGSGWLASTTSVTEFRCGPMRMHVTRKAVLQAIR